MYMYIYIYIYIYIYYAHLASLRFEQSVWRGSLMTTGGDSQGQETTHW